MKIWFTSDEHYGHRAICALSQRPFAPDEMEAVLIGRHNARVAPDDLVIHLGDFSFHNNAESARILSALNGTHYLVLGNHDRSETAMRAIGFAEVDYARMAVIGGTRVFMRHVPPDRCRGDDPRKFAPKFHIEPPEGTDIFLCGHVHENWRTHDKWARPVVNVGVDQWGFAPVSWEEIVQVATW